VQCIILLFWFLNRTMHFMSYRCHIHGLPSSRLLVIVAVVTFLLKQEVCNAGVVSVFHQSDRSIPLRNFIYDSNSRKLYVGGVNVIYRLSANLQQDAAVMLGPHRDIVDCADTSSFSLDCTLDSVTSDSNSQALVLDTDSEVLIACGTLYYGSCAKINAADFSTAEYVYHPVVPNDRSKSVTVLIAPGFTGSNVLYVGAAYSTRGSDALRNMVGLYSVRNLQTFEIASIETSSSSSVQMLPAFQNSYAMQFFRAFHFNNHVYFFFRRSSSLESGELTSHVLRICTDDRRMHSIVELRLECSVSNVVYPYLRDITLTDPPLQIQDDSLITGPSLVGIFTRTADDAGNSAVCIYQMTGLSGVEAAFQSVIQSCFNGVGAKGPEYIVDPHSCTGTVGCFYFLLCNFLHLFSVICTSLYLNKYVQQNCAC